jgi:hypothetical protein
MARNHWVQLFNEDTRGIGSAGLTLATFTTAAPVFGDLVFPAHFFKVDRLVHVRARGTYGTTGAPTYTFRIQQTAGTVGTIVTSAAVTAGTTQTNMPWELDIQIACRAVGASGALFAMGDGNWGLTSTTNAGFYLPAAGTAPANLTTDTTIQQTWQVQVACGTSSASNTVTGQILEVKTIN